MSEPVYVVLVNYNGWADTIECLESLLRGDYDNLRVVVVDNGSTDGSVARFAEWAGGAGPACRPKNQALDSLAWPPVQKPVDCAVVSPTEFHGSGTQVTVVASPKNLGFAGGNNLALRPLADAPMSGYALLINNDMVVAADCVRALVAALGIDTKLAAVGGLILDYWKTDFVQAVGGASMSHVSGASYVRGAGLLRDEARNAAGDIGYVSGGCLLIRLEVLRLVGLMDESYFLYAEDADWGERMRKLGYRLGCAIDAVTYHKGSMTTGQGSPFQDYYLVRGALMFVRKHAPQWLPVAAAYSLWRSLAPKIVRRQWKRAQAVFNAYADVARGR